MKKTQINLIASLLLFTFLFTGVLFSGPTSVAAATKAPVKPTPAAKKVVTKAVVKKTAPFVLKPAPKPTAAEIRAAKQQVIMERSYVSYLKTILPKTKKKIKKAIVKKKVVKKVAKK